MNTGSHKDPKAIKPQKTPSIESKHRNSLQKEPSKEEEAKKAQRAARFSKQPQTQEYGFVSRGEDNRLQKSSKEREKYFNKILKKLVSYCESTDKTTLSKELQKYVKGVESSDQTNVNIDSILSSLRKLRESMINIKPDKFSVNVFLFSIRISANIGHYQTYIPSIHFLLEHGNPILDGKETREIATLLILHMCHFGNQRLAAIKQYFKYFHDSPDPKLLAVISSWCTNDYYTWVKLYNGENDIARSSIMRLGLKSVIEGIIKNIEASYFHLDKNYFLSILPDGVKYEDLEKYGVKWRIDNGSFVIRERRK